MKKIEHEGVVEEVCGNQIKVKIVSQSACASCHVKSACTMADSQEKEIDVESMENVKPGQHVMVVGTDSQGLKAALLAYVLPVVLVLVVLAVTYTVTGNENLSGFLSLMVLVPYFFIIKLAGKAMRKSFTFTIKTINE
ncbi:SoxR reducing system RseC family protein [Alkalitalea saponilacus]|uniref:Positive regulator of sigma(E), RseC/MucC n=1 Tax=Alkalitalea saponilacus TaxID=889453 RepID=A0A1T5HLL7_9BACT|nr:SoxR reducing system RseC family protein [Alkalitalea saponilacus]ASB47832.1 Fis family transcriptional regulator [Alkalitalea saponilacus]SKC21563.1 positive regulator of sigma(E), RseC/MucC [Alkalitalea saponilacus]